MISDTASLAGPISPPSEPNWVLVPDAVWDGDRLLGQHAVVVERHRIHSVVPHGQVPAGLVKVPVSGTAIPGLIDSHVHLADWMLPGFLAAGVTTIRDTGNDLGWILERKKRAQLDPSSSPRILCVGPLIDGVEAYWPPIGRAHSGPDDVGRSVEELAAAGVDAIKLYVNVTTQQMAAAVDTARQMGLPVLAHLGKVRLGAAISTGVGELEHLSGCVHHIDGAYGRLGPTDRKSETASAIREADLVLCPTLVVWDRLARVNDLVFENDRRRRWVHPQVVDAWSGFPHRRAAVEERAARHASAIEMSSALRRLDSAGCRIIAGSDTPWPNIVPGFGLHDELALMVDSGLSPEQALRSATVDAASALRIGEKVGRVAPGLDADVVVTGGNPTEDVFALGDIRMVVRAGKRLRIETLESRFEVASQVPTDDPVSDLIIGQAGVPPSATP